MVVLSNRVSALFDVVVLSNRVSALFDVVVLAVSVLGHGGPPASDVAASDAVQVTAEGRQHQRELEQDGQPGDVQGILKGVRYIRQLEQDGQPRDVQGILKGVRYI